MSDILRQKYFEQIEKDDVKIIFRSSIPELDSKAYLNTFYSTINDRCLRFCAESLPIRLSGGAYTYKLTCRPEYRDEVLQVTLNAALYDDTHRKRIASHTEIHLWSKDGSMLLKPPKDKKKTKAK